MVPPNVDMDPDLCTLRFRQSPAWMRQIVSTSDSVDWFTSNVAGSSVEAHATNQWAAIAKGHEWSKIGRAQNLLVKPPRSFDWYFVLGDSQGVAMLAWPATLEIIGGQITTVSPDLLSVSVCSHILHMYAYVYIYVFVNVRMHAIMHERPLVSCRPSLIYTRLCAGAALARGPPNCLQWNLCLGCRRFAWRAGFQV